MDALKTSLEITEGQKLVLNQIKEGEEFESNGYRVMPVRGNHGPKAGFAHSYIIQKEEKTLLYALDSGTFEEDQMKLMEKFQYDVVIMEGTTGLNEQYGGHMCLVNNIRMRDQLNQRGCLKQGSRFILTHMSPHWCPPHDWYESIVESERMELAYDGKQIEI